MPTRFCLSCDKDMYCPARLRNKDAVCHCGGRLVYESEHPKTAAALIPTTERVLAFYLRGADGFYPPEKLAKLVKSAENRLARMRAVAAAAGRDS
jgi:hypothetical protein